MFSEIPSDLPEDKLQETIANVSEACRKVGLYMNTAGLFIDDFGDEEGHKEHKLAMQFTIGDVALSPRVQDPEQDTMDDEFRKITASSVDDDMDEIRKRYLKNENDD